MKRFTNRVTRDLGQIADRATPSPTAWEKIHQRIDEQTDEPTMEVIMLDPDRKPPTTRPKPWLMVTAAAAAVLVIVGVVVATSGNDDEGGQVTTVDPEPTAAPTETPESEPEPDPDPLATQGAIGGICQTGTPVENTDTGRPESNQRCTFNAADDPPFAESTEATVAQTSSASGVTAVISGDGAGVASAGYEARAPFQGIGIAPGSGAYEGETIYMLLSAAGTDRIGIVWQLDDGPFPAPEPGPDEIVAEVTFECVLTFLDDDGSVATYDQRCTYDGDDPRFVPEPETSTLLVDRGDPLLEAAAGLQFASAVSDTQTLRNGILEDDSVIRWRGVRAGTGEFEGRTIDEIAWGNTDDAGTTSGTIWMTALAPNP